MGVLTSTHVDVHFIPQQDDSKPKPSWYQSKIYPRDALSFVVKILGKELQQVPVVGDDDRPISPSAGSPPAIERSSHGLTSFQENGHSASNQKVVKQSSIVHFLKQNAHKIVPTLENTTVNDLR